jgi:hypothetical protein
MQVKAGKTSFEYTPARPYAQEAFDTDLAAPLGSWEYCVLSIIDVFSYNKSNNLRERSSSIYC